MHVSAPGHSPSRAQGRGSSIEAQINALTSQIVDLSSKIQAILRSDASQKDKKAQVQPIQAQIQALQARIARLLQERLERAYKGEREPVAAHPRVGAPTDVRAAPKPATGEALPRGVIAVA